MTWCLAFYAVHFSSPLLIDVHDSFNAYGIVLFKMNHFIPFSFLLVFGSLFVHGVELPLRIILRSAGFIPFSILLFALGFVFFYESFCVYDFEYSTMVLLTLTILCFLLNHLKVMGLIFFIGSILFNGVNL